MPSGFDLLGILEQIIFEIPEIKKNVKFDLTLIKDVYQVINSITKLDFDSLMNLLVFSDTSIAVPQGPQSPEKEGENEKKKESKKVAAATSNLMDKVYEIFGGKTSDSGFQMFKRLFRILITLASKDIKALKKKPEYPKLMQTLIDDLTQSNFLSFLSGDKNKQERMSMLLFGALSWNLDLILQAFISEETIEEAFLIVNLFTCMKINNFLSDPAKYMNKVK